jgi:hypothetical protein
MTLVSMCSINSTLYVTDLEIEPEYRSLDDYTSTVSTLRQ